MLVHQGVIFAKQVSIFGVHCLTKLIRLTADLAQTIWQINSEERHSFVSPGSDTLDEIDFPTADPAQMHERIGIFPRSCAERLPSALLFVVSTAVMSAPQTPLGAEASGIGL